MYNGLFGDLPSTKQDVKREGTNNKAREEKDDDNTSKEKPPMLFAPRVRTNNNKTNVSKTSFLQKVGTSGTTMAFVPVAALKAKRKKPIDSDASSSNPTTKTMRQQVVTEEPSSSQSSSSFAVSLATTTTFTKLATTTTTTADYNLGVVDIHGNNSSENTPAVVPTLHVEDMEEIVITDPYDPFVPNDLLDYWENLAAKKHREHLEQETQQALEQQKELRKRLEQERSQLLIDSDGRGRGRGGPSNLPAWLVEEQRLQGESGGMGRGRGRSISNLPAWLVEKQRKENSGQQ